MSRVRFFHKSGDPADRVLTQEAGSRRQREPGRIEMSKIRRLSWLVAVASLGLGVCHESGDDGSSGVAPSASESTIPGDPLQRARRRALEPPTASGHDDRQLTALRAAITRMPDAAELWVELGRAWISYARASGDDGYYVHSEAASEVARALRPDSVDALALSALVLLQRHRFAEARDLAAELVRRRPESLLAWASLSDAWLELGDLDQAERAARALLDLKPGLPAYSRVAHGEWLRGRVEPALELFRLAIDSGLDPKHPEPLAWVVVQAAMVFWHRGDLAGADAGFERALAIFPNYAPALVGRGRVALGRGQPAQALALLTRAYREHPLTETAGLVVDAHELAGDSAAWREAWAVVEREGNRDARALSAFYAAHDREPAEALRLARLEREQRGDIETEDALAWALYRNGRYDEARTRIQRARRFGTPDARLVFHHGAIELALGQTRRARSLLREALALNPYFDHRGAAEARALLGERPATVARVSPEGTP